MSVTWSNSQDQIDWSELESLYRLAPLGNKSAEHLRTVFTNSRFKFFAYENGRLVGAGSMLEQTRQCLRNIERCLAAAGATMADVVWTTVYTVDMREFREIVSAREEFARDHLPTSTMVEVNHLSEPGLLVEIQAIAAI